MMFPRTNLAVIVVLWQNDKEQELVPLINAGCNSDFKKVANNLKSGNIVRNGADVREKIKSLQITSSQCQETECSEDDSVSWVINEFYVFILWHG